MRPVSDPYGVLGVRRNASAAEIKAAHRHLAKVHHPDAGGDTTRFLSIQAAYQLLSDPTQRRRWDAAHAPGPSAGDDRARPGRRRSPRTAASPEPARGTERPPTPPRPDRHRDRHEGRGEGTIPATGGPPWEAPSAGDIYARSSGAAWSAASRAYFRRVTADVPRGARMGHSSRTSRAGWEPSAEEIARAVSEATAGRRPRRSAPGGSAIRNAVGRILDSLRG